MIDAPTSTPDLGTMFILSSSLLLFISLLPVGCGPKESEKPAAKEPIAASANMLVSRLDDMAAERKFGFRSGAFAGGSGGARVPPPPLFKLGESGERSIGEGWATRDGHRAVAVTMNQEGSTTLVVLEQDGSEHGLFPLRGFPDGLWATPRWSPDGRFLSYGDPVGLVYTVEIYDAVSRKSVDIFRGVKDYAWAPERSILALSFWPSPGESVAEPHFRFYDPQTAELFAPVPSLPDTGYVFVGFTAPAELDYREYRLGTKDGEETWDPVGERHAHLGPDYRRVSP